MANPVAVFDTSEGTIRAEIYEAEMPITADRSRGLWSSDAASAL